MFDPRVPSGDAYSTSAIKKPIQISIWKLGPIVTCLLLLFWFDLFDDLIN